MAQGRLSEARAELESAVHSSPSNPQICLVLTQLYARMNQVKLRTDSAARCMALARAAHNGENDATVHDYLGKIYLADGRFALALSEYREAVRINPYDESFRFDLAQALLNHEMFAEAAEALEDARRVFDKSAQIELALGVAYYGQRRFAEAANRFLGTIELAPEVVQPYVFLGKMIDQAGNRLPEVTRRFQEFQQANPKSYLGGLLLAKALAASSAEPAQQEKLLRQSIELNQGNWENRYQLGVLLESRRDYESALKQLQQSVALNPEVSDIHYHLARVYDRLGRPEQATSERVIHSQLLSQQKVTAGMEVIE